MFLHIINRHLRIGSSRFRPPCWSWTCTFEQCIIPLLFWKDIIRKHTLTNSITSNDTLCRWHCRLIFWRIVSFMHIIGVNCLTPDSSILNFVGGFSMIVLIVSNWNSSSWYLSRVSLDVFASAIPSFLKTDYHLAISDQVSLISFRTLQIICDCTEEMSLYIRKQCM